MADTARSWPSVIGLSGNSSVVRNPRLPGTQGRKRSAGANAAPMLIGLRSLGIVSIAHTWNALGGLDVDLLRRLRQRSGHAHVELFRIHARHCGFDYKRVVRPHHL